MQNDMPSDHELIRKFQKGDPDAFDEIVRRHLPNVMGFLSILPGMKWLPRTWRRMYFINCTNTLNGFAFESAFTTYLYRINTNTANSWITRNKWKNLLHLDQAPDRGEEDNRLEQEWTKEELWAAIERLPRKQRTVVMMRVAQELPYREIAQVTGMSEGTAKVNFHHALKH